MASKTDPRLVGADNAASARAEREARAGPLLVKVPDLLSLRFTFREAWPGGWLGSQRYVRHVSLEHASALFEPACSNGYCRGGTYDLTATVIDALLLRRARFEGEGGCSGRRGTLACAHRVRFVAAATYRARPSASWRDRLVVVGSDFERGDVLAPAKACHHA